MKAKKLTRKQKEALSAQGLDHHEYLCLYDTLNSMVLVNKSTEKTIVIEKVNHAKGKR